MSVAYNIQKMGRFQAVVLEKEKGIGTASTGRSVGGFRQQFSSEVNIRLSMASVKIIENFSRTMDYPVDVKRNGYMFLASTQDEMNQLEKNVKLQKSLGLEEVRLIDVSKIERICPTIRTEDLLGGTFCPTDGYADPYDFCLGYEARARDLGTEIFLETEVTSFDFEGNRIVGTNTTQGHLSDPAFVVNCTGPFTPRISDILGVDLHVLPYRRQVFDTEPFDLLPSNLPLTIDMHSGLYMRPESAGFIFGKADKNEPPSYNIHTDEDFKFHIVEIALHRFPVLENARMRDGWAGLYDTTPDDHPILGFIRPLENFINASGFSGHGFMHSPVAGILVAELVTYGETKSVDISPLSLERFAAGKQLVERHVI